jgi:hypothetical protein
MNKLTELDFNTWSRLKNSGFLFEFYPESTGNWAQDVGAKSTHSWLTEPEYRHIDILDYDGWDRTNLEQSLEELITQKEFEERLSKSTIVGSGALREFTD